MVLPGESVSKTHPTDCEDCGERAKRGVYESAAGFYIGLWCGCGPYSRDSEYFATREKAETTLKSNDYGRF